MPLPLIVGPPPTPLVRLIVVFPPASIARLPLARSEEKALPPTTWYRNTASNVDTGILLISVKDNAAKSWVNAAFLGANTVSVAELKVAIKVGSPPGALLALTIAFTKESSPDPAACAVATILPDGLFKALDNWCITPLSAAISATATLIPFTYTPDALLVTNTESPPAVITLALGPAGTAAARIFEPMVWYSNKSLSCVELNDATVAELIPAAVKAALSGANTVKGPVPLKVVAKLAFTTASSSTL